MEDELVDEEALEERLSRPTPEVERALASTRGDLLLLGAGGKMGPTLARMARRALPPNRKVVAVARFRDPLARASLEAAGVDVLPRDLLSRKDVDALPDAGAIVWMAGQKFGTTSDASATWAANTIAPANVAERYRGVPTAMFSTGNVYPFTERGASEATPTAPVGEYAWSALARERVWEHASRSYGTPVVILRLNYAVEFRYGVLLEIAEAVRDGKPIDLRMGRVNVIWQGTRTPSRCGRCRSRRRRPRS